MRLSVDYEMSGELLPKDYRSGFMSLIKKAIQEAHPLLFEEYYMRRKLKPFTFSVYFPRMKGSENGSIRVGSEVRLNFSTSSLELATHLYNGFRSEKIKSFPLFQNLITRKDINLRRTEDIRTSEVVFKTASSVLVNNKGDSHRYLLPGEPGFLEGLQFSINEVAREFLKRISDVPFEFEVFERSGERSVKRRVVSHYNQSMSSMVGSFTLKSEPEILQLIYDVGLGVRRSQGFGMLEVVKQECNNGKQ